MPPTNLSDVFKLEKKGHELDFVDVDLLIDTEVYVDPILLYRSAIREFNEAHTLIVEFFNRALEFVEKKQQYKAEGMCHFPDAENLLGVASDSHNGHGPSNKLGYRIYKEIIDNPEIKKNGLVFLNEFQLLIEGISFDLVSDAAVQISKEIFILYTQEQCRKHGIELSNVPIDHCFDWEENEWHSKYALLPCNPLRQGKPFILTPWTVVRRYPEGNYKQFYNEIYKYVLQAREKEHLWKVLGKKPKITFDEIADKYETKKKDIVNYVKENPSQKKIFFNKIGLPPVIFGVEKLSLQLGININRTIPPEILNTIVAQSNDAQFNHLLKKTAFQLKHQFKLKRPKKKILADLQKAIILTKAEFVLLLGNFRDSEGIKRLQEIEDILSKEYSVITLKDVPLMGESLTNTVARFSTLVRFVIVEDSYPGGQLTEIEILKNIEVVAPILREKGKRSSFMSTGKSEVFNNFKEIDYELIEGNGIDVQYVLEAVKWAENRINELGKHWKSQYPWQN